MNIKDLVEKYNLTKNDVWNLKRGNKSMWIITHDACEKIKSIENIIITTIEVVNSERDFFRCIVTAKKEDLFVMTIGEAMKENCTSNYYGCMAEKRGIDRAVLKLINAYEYGIYSESESDEFKEEKNV